MNKTFQNILKGILLIIIFWLFGIFFAFVIFKPVDAHTTPILVSWVISYSFLYLYLSKKGFVNKQVNLFALITILSLIGLYFVPLNNNIPQNAIDLNNEISSKNVDKYQYSKELFSNLSVKWTSETRQYLLEPKKVFFIKDFWFFWNVKGYVPSNIQAQIYRKLLLKSNRFNEKEVFFKQSFCSNSPHGYIEILNDNEIIWADFWAEDNFPRENIEEEYFFGMRTKLPCNELIGKRF